MLSSDNYAIHLLAPNETTSLVKLCGRELSEMRFCRTELAQTARLRLCCCCVHIIRGLTSNKKPLRQYRRCEMENIFSLPPLTVEHQTRICARKRSERRNFNRALGKKINFLPGKVYYGLMMLVLMGGRTRRALNDCNSNNLSDLRGKLKQMFNQSRAGLEKLIREFCYFPTEDEGK